MFGADSVRPQVIGVRFHLWRVGTVIRLFEELSHVTKIFIVGVFPVGESLAKPLVVFEVSTMHGEAFAYQRDPKNDDE